MKVLQVCSAETIGGGERHVIDLTRALLERGHELHVAVRPGSPLVAHFPPDAVQWHEVKLRNAVDLLSVRRLQKIIAEHRLDVVHAHLARDYTLAGLATKGSSARLFLTRHHFNPIKSNAIYEAAIGHATNLLAVSETVGTELAKAFPTLTDRIHVIPNWLDARTEQLATRSQARAFFGIKEFWAVATIGQLTPLKRQDLFIEAIHHLTANGEYERAEFYLIGAANPNELAYEKQLKAQAQEMGLGDRIHFTGNVENLPQYLPAFDVVVAPSENEGFSLVTIEAMAAGCTVLASKVGGMAEIITHNETGILFQPGNAAEIAQLLQRLLFNNHSRKAIGQAAQAFARARYDRKQIVTQIEELYRAQH